MDRCAGVLYFCLSGGGGVLRFARSYDCQRVGINLAGDHLLTLVYFIFYLLSIYV